MVSPRVRRYWQRMRLALRLPSAGARVLPDFVIAGAQKGGTSSLYTYLQQHPQVLPARKKELHFFDRHFVEGVRWYRASFPLRSTLRRRAARHGGRAVTGESSPSYTYHPLAPERLVQTLPDVRVILLLRDPVERAWSHYRMSARRGEDTLSFADAVEREPERLAGEVDRVRSDPAYFSRKLKRYSYVSRGYYDEQVERWLSLLPRERLLVLQSERFFERPDAAYQRVLDFLGLETRPLRDPRVINPGSGDGSLDPALRARLAEHFRPHSERLFELLGERFDWA